MGHDLGLRRLDVLCDVVHLILPTDRGELPAQEVTMHFRDASKLLDCYIDNVEHTIPGASQHGAW